MKRPWLVVVLLGCLLAAVFVLGVGKPGSLTAAGEIRVTVHYDHDWAYAETDPQSTVVFTVSGNQGVKATASGLTDDDGFIGTWDLEWQPEHPDIAPGDRVEAAANSSAAAVDPVGTIDAAMDIVADTIKGHINAPGQGQVTVLCEVYTGEDPVTKEIENVPGANGDYVCDFGGEYDIQAGQEGGVYYYEADGDAVVKWVSPPWVRANYAHRWVGANYPAGIEFTITLMDSGGTVKDTAVIESVSGGGWNTDGFDTNWDDWAGGNPQGPAIMPGDMVEFVASDGFTRTLQIGTIGGDLDIDLDSISGTLDVPWLSGELPVECHPWGGPGSAPGKNSSAAADGSSAYSCQWDPTTEWDIEPGQDVAVMYLEDDHDRVINVFKEAVPNLWVNKRVPGNNVAQPNGPAIFQIEVGNDGAAMAEDVQVVDILPADLAYVADTSGMMPTIVDEKVTWDIGDLAVGERWAIYLVTDNTADPGDNLTNAVEVDADFDEDPNNNRAEGDVNIATGDPDLNMDIHAQPNWPVPGETFLLRINYGNNGPVAAPAATIVVDLPDVVTVVDWHSREGYDLWEGSVTNDQLTLMAPAVPAQWGDTLLLRVALDEGLNEDDCYPFEASIATAGDSDPSNDESSNEFCVGAPAPGAHLEKWFNWGTLYAGGELEYQVYVGADGNVPSVLTLEDRLPAGTSLKHAWLRDGIMQTPFPPDSVSNGTATWNLGEVEPGAEFDLTLRLQVNSDAEPMKELRNCAAISSAAGDVRPFDNEACVIDLSQPLGPNIRVEKRHNWRSEEALEYEIILRNMGSTTVEDLELVDTYPAFTTFKDDWWHNFWEDVQLVKHQPGARKITWEISRLEPNWSTSIYFVVELDQDKVGQKGIAFINQVEAPLSGDIYPGDNSFNDVASSGPDLYVRKWLADPEQVVLPGDEVSFILEFGNRNHWPWYAEGDTLLEDLLPPGLTFVSATDPDDQRQAWEPVEEDGKLQWGWGAMGEGEWHRFELVLVVDDTAKLGTILTNEFKIKSLDNDDKDAVPENNKSFATVRLGIPVYLPVVMSAK